MEGRAFCQIQNVELAITTEIAIGRPKTESQGVKKENKLIIIKLYLCNNQV